MFGFDLAGIAEVVKGRLAGRQGACEVPGAAIDTRRIKAGELFFALPGEKTDGHNFLDQARNQGACGAIVNRIPPGSDETGWPLIVVEDPQKALRMLAVAQRRLFRGPVVALTGSTGKTTTKDMLYAILSERGPVLRNTGNYNNELGLPLTLLGLQREHWAVTVEMGMRGLGEIDYLSVISAPTHGAITNIGHTHQELLGSQQKIAQAKAELFSHLPGEGGLVLNKADKELLQPWLSNVRCPLHWIGTELPADFLVQGVKERIVDGNRMGLEFVIIEKGQEACRVVLPVPGRHNAANALMAAGLARQLGLEWEEIKKGLEKVTLTPMRLEIIDVPKWGIQVINDAYNANPASMTAALDVLRAAAHLKRGIAVLGDMYELGDYTLEGHLEVGKKAKEVHPAYLITVGELGAQIALGAQKAGLEQEKIKACQNNQEALSYIKDILKPGDVVLVKGSRGVKMEEIVSGLQ